MGFLASLVILIVQFPMMAAGMILNRNFTTIPGAFSNILAIVAITVIYINHSRIHKYQRRILTQAVTDSLTGLPNRFACHELMEDLAKGSRKFALVSVDLNNFKSINDTMGHDIGDKVLLEIAARWKALSESHKSGTYDFVARLGGDEYAFVIQGYTIPEDIERSINAYKAELEKKITIDDCDYFMTACFGYAEYMADAMKSGNLFSCADAAMHEAKRIGGDVNVMRFSQSLLSNEKTLALERKVRAALANDRLFFNLQPQYDMDKNLRGFEALARMRDSDGRLISPADFIPVAEKVGLVDKIDATVFRMAAAFVGKIIRERGADIVLCMNVSVRHLMKNNFIDELKEIVSSCGIPSRNLEIEITESVMIDSAEKALDRIRQVKEMGIKVALDDFGTGYSSLSYLNKFPADMLKIDKSFIDVMNTSESSKQYVATIISIGHILNLKVISEGVESEDQLDTLRKIGCDYIQGFIWGKPLPQEAAAKLVS